MISKQLEQRLVEYVDCTPGEMTQRFQKLRDAGVLPKSRGEHAVPLRTIEIASALLGVVPEKPGYAGLKGKALANLRPVGGSRASFRDAPTLGEAVSKAIDQPQGFIELEVLDGEFGVNSYGYAALHHDHGTAHFVHYTALSLLQERAEETFNPHNMIRDKLIQRKVTFNAQLFTKLSRCIVDTRSHREHVERLRALAGDSGKTFAASTDTKKERLHSSRLHPMQLLSIAVHSSVGLERDEYYFLYKNMQLKFVPQWKKGDSDIMTARFSTRDTLVVAYKLMTEFLSVFAFEMDAALIPSPGIVTPTNFPLDIFTGGWVEKRKVPVSELLSEFLYIPPVRRDDQAALLRLYRVARAAGDVYAGVLFFWHVLVYPEKDDQKAVDWIDHTRKAAPPELNHVIAIVDRVLANPLFTPGASLGASLGAYIKNGVRHAIAHIVRNKPNARNLDLDNLDEVRHLSDVQTILRYYAHYRLERDFCLSEPHDERLFRYFNPRDEEVVRV